MANKRAPRVVLIGDTGGESMRLVSALSTKSSPKRQIPSIGRAPDIERVLGRAWRCDIETLRKRFSREQVASDATLDAWIIEAPYAHPVWHSYCLILVHLRGAPETTKFYRADATHEFWLLAMDPDFDRHLGIVGEVSPYEGSMLPLNFAAQLACADDADAQGQIRRAVEDVCAGDLNPDTDFRAQWIGRFGDNMMRDAFK